MQLHDSVALSARARRQGLQKPAASLSFSLEKKRYPPDPLVSQAKQRSSSVDAQAVAPEELGEPVCLGVGAAGLPSPLLFLGAGARVGPQPSCSSSAVPLLDDVDDAMDEMAVWGGVPPRPEALVAAEAAASHLRLVRSVEAPALAPACCHRRAATSASRVAGSIDSPTADASTAGGANAGCSCRPFPWLSGHQTGRRRQGGELLGWVGLVG